MGISFRSQTNSPFKLVECLSVTMENLRRREMHDVCQAIAANDNGPETSGRFERVVLPARQNADLANVHGARFEAGTLGRLVGALNPVLGRPASPSGRLGNVILDVTF